MSGKKRFLSMFLCFIMVFGMLPSNIFSAYILGGTDSRISDGDTAADLNQTSAAPSMKETVSGFAAALSSEIAMFSEGDDPIVTIGWHSSDGWISAGLLSNNDFTEDSSELPGTITAEFTDNIIKIGLNNASLDALRISSDMNYNINIVLTGTNTITAAEASLWSPENDDLVQKTALWIESHSDVTINGGGTLVLTASETAFSGKIADFPETGTVMKKLTIDGCIINAASSGETSGNDLATLNMYANMVIDGGATVTAWRDDDISFLTSGDVTIENGTLNTSYVHIHGYGVYDPTTETDITMPSNLVISEKGILNIESHDLGAGMMFFEGSNMVIDGGAVNLNNYKDDSQSIFLFNGSEEGENFHSTLTINSGSLKITHSGYGGNAIYLQKNGSFIQNGGTVSISQTIAEDQEYGNCLQANDGSSAEINGGSFSVENMGGFLILHDSSMLVTGTADINVESGVSDAMLILSGSKLNMTGGSFVSTTGTEYGILIDGNNDQESDSVTTATFQNCAVTADALAVYNGAVINIGDGAEMNLNTREVTRGEYTFISPAIKLEHSATLNISGGIVNIDGLSGLGVLENTGYNVVEILSDSAANPSRLNVFTGELNIKAEECVGFYLEGSGAELAISGGSVSVELAAIDYNNSNPDLLGIHIDPDTDLLVTGGKFTIDAYKGAEIRGSVVVSGGEFTINGDSFATYISDSGVFLISGGKVDLISAATSGDFENSPGYAICNDFGTMNITGGVTHIKSGRAIAYNTDTNEEEYIRDVFVKVGESDDGREFKLGSGLYVKDALIGSTTYGNTLTGVRFIDGSLDYGFGYRSGEILISGEVGTEPVYSDSIEITSGTVTAGARFNVRSFYILGSSSGSVVYILPDDTTYVDGSLTINGIQAVGGYVYDAVAHTLTVINLNSADIVRFSLISSTADTDGFHLISMTVYVNGVAHTNSPTYKVMPFTLSVPTTTNKLEVSIAGVCAEGSKVTIYDNDDEVAVFTASSIGIWAKTIVISEVTDHIIKATIEVAGQITYSIEYHLTYVPDKSEPTTLIIINTIHGVKDDERVEKDVIINFINYVYSSNFITYWPELPTFTFKVTFSDNSKVDKATVIATDKNGIETEIELTYDQSTGEWIGTGVFDDQYNIPDKYRVRWHLVNADSDYYDETRDVTIPIAKDPSGYVYEGFKNNRLSDVTATIYYSVSETDHSDAVIWDASAYDQVNPVTTDILGQFMWIVPDGWWKIVFEKEGYITAESDWLPVPPVQTDIDICMISESPATSSVNLLDDGTLLITFDRPVPIISVNSDNISILRENQSVDGKFTPVDSEWIAGGINKVCATQFIFTPSGTDIADGALVTITFSDGVTTYAGISSPGTLTFSASKSYKVSFESNGGTEIKPVSGAYGDRIDLNGYVPVRRGYTFTGWYSSAALTDRITAITLGSDVTVYAGWKEINYGYGVFVPEIGLSVGILQFNVNGGSQLADITRLTGTKVDLSAYTTTRDGYVFTGWYSDSSLKNRVTEILIDKNTTVYAGWLQIQTVSTAEDISDEKWTNPFSDVSDSDWFYSDVEFICENKLMQGTATHLFSPELATTRGMIVTILYRMENLPDPKGSCPFNDVKPGSYYEDAITWASENGIVSGYGDGSFGPDDEITREQLAAIICRYAKFKGYDVSGRAAISGFADYNEISGYAVEAVAWSCKVGLINGVGENRLDPAGFAIRSQAAAILHRFIVNIVN